MFWANSFAASGAPRGRAAVAVPAGLSRGIDAERPASTPDCCAADCQWRTAPGAVRYDRAATSLSAEVLTPASRPGYAAKRLHRGAGGDPLVDAASGLLSIPLRQLYALLLRVGLIDVVVRPPLSGAASDPTGAPLPCANVDAWPASASSAQP